MSATVADASNPWISWSHVQDNWSGIGGCGAEHIYLTVGSVILAVVVAVPLAMVIRRSPKLSGPILGLSGVLYTIPSLALISLLWPVSDSVRGR